MQIHEAPFVCSDKFVIQYFVNIGDYQIRRNLRNGIVKRTRLRTRVVNLPSKYSVGIRPFERTAFAVGNHTGDDQGP